MSEPVDITHGWHRARFDDSGVWIDRKPPIPWEDIKAAGVAYRQALLVIPHFAALGAIVGLLRPMLHLCVASRDYPVPVPAIAFDRVWMPEPDVLARRFEPDLRAALGEWVRRIPVICPPGDLGFWWVGHGGWYPSYGPPRTEHVEPTTHERAEKIQRDLNALNDQLGRIENRKKNGHPPA
jgi:hypothetical protein